MTFGIRRLAQIPRTARIVAIVAAALALLVPIREAEALAMPVVVNDVDFAADVYEFRYYPKTATDHNVTLTNTGWAGPFAQAGVDYWQSTGLIAGELTMGWDFTGVTKPIAKVELGTRNHLFQFAPWIQHAFEDRIFGDVATPSAFGAGPYTNMYTFTGDGIGAVSALGYGQISEITSFIATGWLNDPGLLELRFSYEQHPIDGTHPDIPVNHFQVFRDNTGTGNVDGFTLRVTLAPEPSSVPSLSGWGLALTGVILVLLLAARAARTRRVA